MPLETPKPSPARMLRLRMLLDSELLFCRVVDTAGSADTTAATTTTKTRTSTGTTTTATPSKNSGHENDLYLSIQ